MKAIMVMFDSLNRHSLPPYGCNWVHAANFKRLVQTIDFPPTILEYFGIDIPQDMQGKPLKDTISDNKPVREAAIFGVHGGHVNCTDGRYIYMRAPVIPKNSPLFNYTLMPTHMARLFSIEELQTAEFHEPFSFSKGCSLMKIKAAGKKSSYGFGHLLFDTETDPGQERPISNIKIENRMIEQLIRLMKENDAPIEQYERLGLKI